MRKLILFDIDGTLLWSRGAPKRAFLRAMIEVYGTAGPIATHAFGGKTDPQIARELLRLEGFVDAVIDEGFVRLWGIYANGLKSELQKDTRETIVLPGVRELISALERRTDVLVGLLTGNIEAGAVLKLEAVGLHGRFRLGAYGSDRERREDLPAVAVERARAHAGRDFRGREIVVIGDTPADMTCGRALDVHALGVTTGTFDAASLHAAGAHAVFADLADTDRVLEALLA
jgi:phosphoglycolate phosphatase